MGKIIDLERWRVEIESAEEFRDRNFGEYTDKSHLKAGANIDYFERGFSNPLYSSDIQGEDVLTTLNFVHSIVKNVVPSLYFQNPRILATPKKQEFQETAPIVSNILNYYYKALEIEEINQRVIWDAYVLGHGYYKVGYATNFGMDIIDDKVRERPQRTIVDKGLEALGLKEKPKQSVVHPEINYRIVSESPYIQYISPFNFGRDPRANSLEESMYWYHKSRRTVKYMKNNRKYKNTAGLVGQDPVDINMSSLRKVRASDIEDFKTVEVYEIHYRCDNEIYILVASLDGENFGEHYHEESVYEIDGFQVGELTFNKHGHSAFAISDISKIKNLQDRFTNTIDTILEQVDKFTPKLAYSEDITLEGERALRDGDIGALVKTTKNPNEVFKELMFTQVKGDLRALTDQLIDIITIQTGITRAQLTGMSISGTATEATIAQGGQTLRLSDMTQEVNRMARNQAKKLWQIIKQFVELEELELINGTSGVDANGIPMYTWLTVDAEKREKMQIGEYDFDIEVGSTQKPDLAQVRSQFENLFSILSRTDVVMLMQQQGDKIVISELLKLYLQLFPEAVRDIGKVLQKITPQTQGLLAPESVENRGGMTPGSNFNALESQAAKNNTGGMTE